jgi:hypothetical protein
VSEERLVAGRYRLVNRIGGGGIGVVRQAYDEWLHRKVAVKHLLIPAKLTGPQTEEARQRAMREGRIAAKLAHPHAIGVYDVLEDCGGRGIALKISSSPAAHRTTEEESHQPADEQTDRKYHSEEDHHSSAQSLEDSCRHEVVGSDQQLMGQHGRPHSDQQRPVSARASVSLLHLPIDQRTDVATRDSRHERTLLAAGRDA